MSTTQNPDLCQYCDPDDEPIAEDNRPRTCEECGIKVMEPLDVDLPERADVSIDHSQPVEERIQDIADIFEQADNGELDGKLYIDDLLPEWCENDDHDHMTGYYHTTSNEWCPVCGVPYEHVHCGEDGCEQITQIS